MKLWLYDKWEEKNIGEGEDYLHFYIGKYALSAVTDYDKYRQLKSQYGEYYSMYIISYYDMIQWNLITHVTQRVHVYDIQPGSYQKSTVSVSTQLADNNFN